MKLEPYPEYQETGVQWLGSVPKHWRILEPRRVFTLRREPEKPHDVHLTPSQHFGVLPQAQYMELTGSRVVLNLSGTLMQHVEPGDFISHLRTFQGGLELARMPGKVSPAYTVVSPLPVAEPNYFKYVFKSQGYISQIASITDQLRDGQTMRFAEFNKTPVPLPPLSEQRMIADFLDHETAEIDAFIDDQQRLIELLEERRDATIAHAVTKGLDPNAPMKDSGVESLGDVVAEWDVVAVSRFVSFGNGSDYKHVEVANGGYPVIGSGGEFRRASEYLFDGESVLFGRKGTVNKPLYVTGKFWTVDTMYYTNIDTRYLLPKFLYYWALRIPFDFYLTNTALPSMTQTDLGSAKIALPDRAEQDMIVEYLDRETAEIDAAVSDAQEAIALSRERRAALISAAVTGQLDVSQAQSRRAAGEVLEEEVRV